MNIRNKCVYKITSGVLVMNDLNERVAEVLKDLIKEKGIKKESLASYLGKNQASVYRMLNGQSKLSFDSFEKLSVLLDTPVSTIVRRAEQIDQTKWVSEKAEELICSSSLHYSFFVALEVPRSIAELMQLFSLNEKVVNKIISIFIEHGIIRETKNRKYHTNSTVFGRSLGKNPKYYNLKNKLFDILSSTTKSELDLPGDFWTDKDDSMIIARLKQDEIKRIALEIDLLKEKISSLSSSNSENSDFLMDDDSSDKIYSFFFTFKPLINEYLKDLASEKELYI